MDGSLKTFAKQWAKNAEKQPGWVYLLAFIYLILHAVGVPSQIDVAGWQLAVPTFSAEVWATLLALFLYQVGDALDKVTFKKRNNEGEWVDRYKLADDVMKSVRGKFGVNDGIYDVSLKILEKAKQGKFSVHFINEMAKFLRSLILPALIIAVVFSLGFPVGWAAVLLSIALLCAYVLAFHIYPRLKNLHRANLYKAVVALPAADVAKITYRDITVAALPVGDGEKITHQGLGKVRMFFWEGVLVAAAPMPKPANSTAQADSCAAA